MRGNDKRKKKVYTTDFYIMANAKPLRRLFNYSRKLPQELYVALLHKSLTNREQQTQIDFIINSSSAMENIRFAK